MTRQGRFDIPIGLILIALGWVDVGFLTMTSWHDLRVALFAAASVVTVVLSGFLGIDVATLARGLQGPELSLTDSDFWQQHLKWSGLPPPMFAAALLLGTRV